MTSDPKRDILQKYEYRNFFNLQGYKFRLNELTDRIELNGEEITDKAMKNIVADLLGYGFKSIEITNLMIESIAYENRYDPLREYILSLKWDGIPRIGPLTDCFDDETNMFWIYLPKWMIGSVARILNRDGARNPVVILDGNQEIGKSKFVEWLCPLRSFHREGSINPEDKDHRAALTSTWIWEISEFGATTRKADREQLKNFLTEGNITVRRAWGRNEKRRPSVASFIATVNNESGILSDPTGSSRFRICRIRSIDWREYTQRFTPEQLWAEAFELWKTGATNALSSSEKAAAAKINADYKVLDATEEAITKWFIVDPDDNVNYLTYNEIRDVLRDPTQGNLTAAEFSDTRIGRALCSLGLKKSRRWVTYMPNQPQKLSVVYYGIRR